ncbi:MAG: NfeD family protein [Bacilli bacterium]|jgi:membrane protein implicated in regulation of membrane protease activity
MGLNEIFLFVWTGVFVVAILVELFTTDLVSIWFCGGSIVALVLCAIGMGIDIEPMWWISIIVFAVVSILLLFALRPVAKKLLMQREMKSNVDELIGMKARVIKDITELERGEIKIHDVVWTAEASNPNEVIKKDDIVVVLAIEGNKAIVKKYEIK